MSAAGPKRPARREKEVKSMKITKSCIECIAGVDGNILVQIWCAECQDVHARAMRKIDKTVNELLK